VEGDRVRETGRKGDEKGEKGAGEEGAGSGRKRENYATLRNISQRKKSKEVGANKYRAGRIWEA